MALQKLLLGTLILVCIQGASAFADNYKLSCDDNNIFEQPLTIEISDNIASAEGEFSGPGDALFDVTYNHLYVLDLKTSGDTLKSLTITQPHVVRRPTGFQLSLKRTGKHTLKGHLTMNSTDRDQMEFDGDVSCVLK